MYTANLRIDKDLYTKNQKGFSCELKYNKETCELEEVVFPKIKAIKVEDGTSLILSTSNISIKFDDKTKTVTDNFSLIKEGIVTDKPINNINNIIYPQQNNLFFLDKDKMYEIPFEVTSAYMCIYGADYTNKLMKDYARKNSLITGNVIQGFSINNSFDLLAEIDLQADNDSITDVNNSNNTELNKMFDDTNKKIKALNNDIGQIKFEDKDITEPDLEFINDICPICLDKFSELSEKIVSLSCGCLFCKPCIMNLSKENCPKCSRPFIKSSVDINRVLRDIINQDKFVIGKTILSKLIKEKTQCNQLVSHIKKILKFKKIDCL